MRVLKVNPDVDWELTVARVVYFERRLVNRNERLREALMDLKLDLFDEERYVLLLHGIIRIVRLPEATNVSAPFVCQREVVARHVHILAHLLSHGAYDNGHADFLAFNTFDLNQFLLLSGHHGAVETTIL